MAAIRRAHVVTLHVAPTGSKAAGEVELNPSLESLPGQQLTTRGADGYVFTHGGGILSVDQRDFYESSGYLVIRNNLPQGDVAAFCEHFARLCAGEVQVARGVQVVRDLGALRQGGKATLATIGTINKVQNVENDPVLFSYARHPSILQYLPDFTGSNGAKVVPFTSMLVNKPPDVGLGTSRHPLHQDMWFFPFRPANKVVAAWTALQRVTRENGALFAVPGTHSTSLCRHVKPDDGPVNAGFVGIEGSCSEADADRADVVWIEMEPGDTVFFHPLLHHGSGRNISTTTRQAISMHYVGTDCVYFDPLLDVVQAERAKRVTATGGHQYGDGSGIEIVDMYKRRLRRPSSPNSRPVFGREGTHHDAI